MSKFESGEPDTLQLADEKVIWTFYNLELCVEICIEITIFAISDLDGVQGV